jgi:hypothetical protein
MTGIGSRHTMPGYGVAQQLLSSLLWELLLCARLDVLAMEMGSFWEQNQNLLLKL